LAEDNRGCYNHGWNERIIAMSDEGALQALSPRAERVVDFRGEMITIAIVEDMPYVALRSFADYL
jgi:hypothetical protein